MPNESLKRVLVVDMTHGGSIIALEFSKLPSVEVFAWDIYQTLNDQSKEKLMANGVTTVDEDFLSENLDYHGHDLIIVAPIHCKLEYPVDMTHHEAVAFLMENRIKVPFIEVTGVKGKTSVVHMLKEIFKGSNPLILSSLGVEVVEDGESKLLKQDISITPASIIEAWELAQSYSVGIFIAETSLGGTGLADVGVLTNIAENYSIASGMRSASQAKSQIFKSKMVVCDYSSFKEFYSDGLSSDVREKTNTFGVDLDANREGSSRTPQISSSKIKLSKINSSEINAKASEMNVEGSQIKFGFNETCIRVEVNGLKTIPGQHLEDKFEVLTFAPAPHHVQNVLSAICASLTLGTSKNTVISGLKNFSGLRGRTSITRKRGVRLIEEINPGINLTTVKKAIGMVEALSNRAVIFGGKYGVTCEEIDEESVSTVLNELNEDIQLILTDELGAGVREGIQRDFYYATNVEEAVDYAVEKGIQNVLLIYRSNFPDLIRR